MIISVPEDISIRDNNWAADISIRDSHRSRKYQLRDSNEFHNTITYVIAQTVDKALLLQGFAIVGTAFLI